MHIDRKETGGQIKIDYFSTEDLRQILDLIKKSEIGKKPTDMLENHIQTAPKALSEDAVGSEMPLDDRSKEEIKADDADLYNISNFSV